MRIWASSSTDWLLGCCYWNLEGGISYFWDRFAPHLALSLNWHGITNHDVTIVRTLSLFALALGGHLVPFFFSIDPLLAANVVR